jgi:hypothetical protein
MRVTPIRPAGIFAAVFLLVVQLGCSTERVVTISTRPVPANIRVDGRDRGTAPYTAPFVFDGSKAAYRVELSRPGYKDQQIEVTKHSEANVVVDLKPLTKKIVVVVRPFPANVSINGKQMTSQPVSNFSADLEFTLDSANRWTTYKITAERPGFQPAERSVTWTDADSSYTLTLEPMRKDVTITTTPPGARVFMDEEEIGSSPLTYRGSENKGVAFYIDPQTNHWNEYKVHVVKPGYDAIDARISWDEGKTDYAIDLKPKSKTVRIVTNPPGGVVRMEGRELERDASGASVASLVFLPINDRGDLKTFSVTASKKAADSEWEPRTAAIGWDEGRTDYSIALKEIKTTPLTLLIADPRRGDEGWSLARRSIVTTAMKDVSEAVGREQPRKLTNLPRGTVIDTLAISPDGSKLVFTVLQSRGENDLRSQMLMIRTDGSGGVESFSDGRSLDLQPSFTPDGRNVVYSSNRGGRRQSIWRMSAAGNPGVTQLTNDDNNDVWPSIDAARHLFYQAFVDTRSDPRLFMTEEGKTTRTDLTQAGGYEPRVSPETKPDSGTLLFTNVNEKTGKRDIYSVKTDGGIPENITNTPDVDDFNPAWNHEGTKIALVSDRGVDEEQRHNFDVWIIDLVRPSQPIQLTSNGSWDDCPVWDPGGNSIYFRSNRGGEWAIWKMAVK